MEPFPLLSRHPLTLVRPGPTPAPDVLFRAEHVVVTRERFEVDGRAWRLDYIQGVAVECRPPRLVPLQVGLVLLGALLLLPAVLLVSSRLAPGSGLGEALLVVAAIGLFASVARLMLLTDTYWLEMQTAYGATYPYHSTDRDHVVHLAEVLQQAVEDYGQREA